MSKRFDVNYEMSEAQVEVENRLEKNSFFIYPRDQNEKNRSPISSQCVFYNETTHIRTDKERETRGKSFSNKSNILLTQSTVKRHRTSQLKATTEKWSMTTENSEKKVQTEQRRRNILVCRRPQNIYIEYLSDFISSSSSLSPVTWQQAAQCRRWTSKSILDISFSRVFVFSRFLTMIKLTFDRLLRNYLSPKMLSNFQFSFGLYL